MQWKPMKEYQAPAYLAKAATLLAATTLLNGCGNLPVTPVDPPQSSTTTQTTIQQTTTAMSGAAAIPQETTISTPPLLQLPQRKPCLRALSQHRNLRH